MACQPSSPAHQPYAEFAAFVLSQAEELLPLAETTAGPVTDRKAYRGDSEDGYRSYNDRYCRDFFAHHSIQKAYQLYLDVTFAEGEEDVWAENWGFQAVGAEKAERLQAWEELRTYLASDLVTELIGI